MIVFGWAIHIFYFIHSIHVHSLVTHQLCAGLYVIFAHYALSYIICITVPIILPSFIIEPIIVLSSIINCMPSPCIMEPIIFLFPCIFSMPDGFFNIMLAAMSQIANTIFKNRKERTTSAIALTVNVTISVVVETCNHSDASFFRPCFSVSIDYSLILPETVLTFISACKCPLPYSQTNLFYTTYLSQSPYVSLIFPFEKERAIMISPARLLLIVSDILLSSINQGITTSARPNNTLK